MNTAAATVRGMDAKPKSHSGAHGAAWRAYAGVSSGAVDEKELIERFLPLVRNVVDRIKLTLPPHIDADDLYSVGVTGLLAAVRKYDPAQGDTFAGYAALRIRGAVLDELRRMDWCPRRTRARARKLKESINALEQKLGRTATEDEICDELGLSHAEYAKWLDEVRPVAFIALDQHFDGEESEGASLHEILADENDTTGRESLEKQELLQLLSQRIAAVFGLTESRICQIHSQTIIGLRAFLGRARNR